MRFATSERRRYVMKILAWLLFGTSCLMFADCFCRQQFGTPQDDYAAYQQTSENWRRIRESDSFEAPPPPTTRPAPAPNPTVAATDLGDATK